MRLLACLFVIHSLTSALAQGTELSGQVMEEGVPLPFVTMELQGTSHSTLTNDSGYFHFGNLEPKVYRLSAKLSGYSGLDRDVDLSTGSKVGLRLDMEASQLGEVVVTGTMKEMARSDSPVSIEVFSSKFFKKNPTPSVYEALQNVNGVRPQLNCNVCNTGDIHINGLEGPYTMVLIDGMPLVGGLASVYGLSGIPNAMVERMEIVKGPASTLYGSEAVGGLINVITKNPSSAPVFSAEVMGTSWAEFSGDIGLKVKAGKKADMLTGISYFNYQLPTDRNGDGFTDVTLQDRISVFQKWNFSRKQSRLFSLAGRFLYEDRWGGQMEWHPVYRGGDQVYGESIRTKRWELFGSYQLPMKERLILSFSANKHDQDSYYGDLPFFATQGVAFSQLTWDKELGMHGLLIGATARYTYYDDNTTATQEEDSAHVKVSNAPDHVVLPGIFVQDDITFGRKHRLLLGMRMDHHSEHGFIWTPRMAYKWSLNRLNTLRLNAGTGFRVVNLFTEEHAALTGARTVVVVNELRPEQSYNVNLNYVTRIPLKKGSSLGMDVSGWYTYFTNQILPDYDSDPNLIIYDNLEGNAVTRGVTMNVDLTFRWGLKAMLGATYMDVYSKTTDPTGTEIRAKPVLTETWTGTWSLSYSWQRAGLSMDYTGNLYSPMRLPILGELDPRDENSPWWSIQNIQLTWRPKGGMMEIYGGVKNLLNFTPPANSIARSHDPFDEQVQFDVDGSVLSTPENPYALTFDPSYVYAPNQGIRGFLGVRMTIR